MRRFPNSVKFPTSRPRNRALSLLHRLEQSLQPPMDTLGNPFRGSQKGIASPNFGGRVRDLDDRRLLNKEAADRIFAEKTRVSTTEQRYSASRAPANLPISGDPWG
jgi:hypothetical protein